MKVYNYKRVGANLICITKLRLSSHRCMVERGRWMKPKVQYIDRKCTLRNDNDIQDEYHIVLKCEYYNEVRRQ